VTVKEAFELEKYLSYDITRRMLKLQRVRNEPQVKHVWCS